MKRYYLLTFSAGNCVLVSQGLAIYVPPKLLEKLSTRIKFISRVWCDPLIQLKAKIEVSKSHGTMR